MNLIQPQFTNRDVLRVLPDLHPDVFQDLVNRRLIQPESERNPGYGKKRLYSAENVLQIALVHALLETGLTPGEAVFMCDRNTVQEIRPEGRLPFYALVRVPFGRGPVNRERQYMMYKPGYVFSDGKKCELPELIARLQENGIPAIVLFTRKIEETTMAELEKILNERGPQEAKP